STATAPGIAFDRPRHRIPKPTGLGCDRGWSWAGGIPSPCSVRAMAPAERGSRQLSIENRRPTAQREAPRRRNGGEAASLDPAPRCHAGESFSADDDVIEKANVYKVQCLLQARGDRPVGCGWLQI